MEKGE